LRDNMKFLVTGGMGFIGSSFVHHILFKYKDAKIVNLDNLSAGSNLNNLKDLKGNKRYKFAKGNITNSNLVSKLMKDAEVVVNFAAETHVDRSISNPFPFFESNIQGVFTLLECLRKSAKTKLVHISTDEVYGDITRGSFKESDPLKPSSPYSASKAAADMLALAYWRTYNLDVSITRCTNNFGPFQHPEKFIPKTIIRASLNLPIPIYGSGKNIRDWIYVLDHCKAVDLVIKKGRPGGIYNISTGNEFENLEVVKKSLELMNKPEDLITFVKDRPGHGLRYSLDSSKLRKLGWRPNHDFQKALECTVDWYEQNKWWWKPIATEKVLHPSPWELRW